MREAQLLHAIYQRSAHLTRQFPHVLTGPGDDCAVIATPSPSILLTTDQLVRGTHFLPDTPIELIAHKAIARAVSDIAAMAGTPRWALAAAALPQGFEHADALFHAMADAAESYACPLVGGDISSTPPTTRQPALVLTITVGGDPHPTRGPVLRSHAQPGDDVYVTGSLGGSFHSGRHLRVQPRLAEARALADTLGPSLHAMIDLSDGAGRDAARIALASNVRIELDTALLPIHPDAAHQPDAHHPHHAQDPWRAALADGEDYELLFTAPPASFAQHLHKLNALLPNTTITRIGRVAHGSGCVARLPDASTLDIQDLGFDHHL